MDKYLNPSAMFVRKVTFVQEEVLDKSVLKANMVLASDKHQLLRDVLYANLGTFVKADVRSYLAALVGIQMGLVNNIVLTVCHVFSVGGATKLG